RGFVFAPFRDDELLAGIFGRYESPGITFKLYDGSAATPDALLHDSGAVLRQAGARTSGELHGVRELEMAGRPWRLELPSLPRFVSPLERSLPRVVGVLGGSNS